MHNLGHDIAFDIIKPSSQQLDSFFENVDVAAIINEASSASGQGAADVDDGPIGYWANQRSYRGATSTLAEKMGMTVLNYLVPEEEFFQHDTAYPKGPTGTVSYFPNGATREPAGTKWYKDLEGSAAFRAYKKHIKMVATTLGFELIDFLGGDQKDLAAGKQDLTEAVVNKGSFKAIFLAGGPGSGKSGVVDAIFNTKPSSVKSLTSTGLKVVNSDQAFEYLKKKHNIPTDAEDMTDDERSLDGKLMYKSVQIAKKQLENYLQGKLGVIIDGTGASSNSLLKKKKQIEDLGYDTYMIFVHTTLDTALARNKARKTRSLLDKVVERTWNKVQANLETYRSAFKGNFTFVSTEDTKEGELPKGTKRAVMRFVGAPIKNKTAQSWIAKAKKVM